MEEEQAAEDTEEEEEEKAEEEKAAFEVLGVVLHSSITRRHTLATHTNPNPSIIDGSD